MLFSQCFPPKNNPIHHAFLQKNNPQSIMLFSKNNPIHHAFLQKNNPIHPSCFLPKYQSGSSPAHHTFLQTIRSRFSGLHPTIFRYLAYLAMWSVPTHPPPPPTWCVSPYLSISRIFWPRKSARWPPPPPPFHGIIKVYKKRRWLGAGSRIWKSVKVLPRPCKGPALQRLRLPMRRLSLRHSVERFQVSTVFTRFSTKAIEKCFKRM